MENMVGNHKALKLTNQEKLLGLLSKKKYSISRLSAKTGLSITGVTTLMNEFLKYGIVEKVEAKSSSGVGRHPLRWKISPTAGAVAVVTFSRTCNVVFYSLTGEEKYRFSRPLKATRMTKTELVAIAKEMHQYMQANYPDTPLLTLTLAVPGKVDKKGQLLDAPYFEDYRNIDLREIFNDELNTCIIIQNDLNVALCAEYYVGEYRKLIENTLFLQIGTGVGAALFLNGKLHEGHNGLSGEIGLFLVDYQARTINNHSIHNKYFYNYCSYERIVGIVKNNIIEGVESSLLGDDITIEKVAAAYKAGDPLCVGVVEDVARVVGMVLRSITELFDLGNIIVAKSFNIFGNTFIKSVETELNRNRKGEFIPIYMSSVEPIHAEEVGAKLMGIEKGIEILCSILSNKPKEE